MSTNQTQHTPGPWERIGNLVRGPYAMGDKDKPGIMIAECPQSDPDASANARLIATAPELLEALRGLLAVHDSVTQGQENELRQVWVPKARAALAKAAS